MEYRAAEGAIRGGPAPLIDFIALKDEGGRTVKQMACYHLRHTLPIAVRETLRAAELHRSDAAMVQTACMISTLVFRVPVVKRVSRSVA